MRPGRLVRVPRASSTFGRDIGMGSICVFPIGASPIGSVREPATWNFAPFRCGRRSLEEGSDNPRRLTSPFADMAPTPPHRVSLGERT